MNRIMRFTCDRCGRAAYIPVAEDTFCDHFCRVQTGGSITTGQNATFCNGRLVDDATVRHNEMMGALGRICSYLESIDISLAQGKGS